MVLPKVTKMACVCFQACSVETEQMENILCIILRQVNHWSDIPKELIYHKDKIALVTQLVFHCNFIFFTLEVYHFDGKKGYSMETNLFTHCSILHGSSACSVT